MEGQSQNSTLFLKVTFFGLFIANGYYGIVYLTECIDKETKTTYLMSKWINRAWFLQGDA